MNALTRQPWLLMGSRRLAVPAPALSFDFSAGVPSPFTFTRASTATDSTYQDSPNQQTYNTLATNVPLIDIWGVKSEPPSTNFFLNSDAPVTQTITLPQGATAYSVWFVGSGSVALSITGNGTILGTTPVVSGAFCTVSVGSGGANLTCTLSGTIYRVQVESFSTPTSYIPTGGTTVTRTETRISANFLTGQLSPTNGTYWIEFLPRSSGKLMTAGVGSFTQDNETDQLFRFNSTIGSGFTVYTPGATNAGAANSGATTSDAFVQNRIERVAGSYTSQRIAVASNSGVAVARSPMPRPASLLAITLGGGGFQSAGSLNMMNGYIRGFRYWNTALSDLSLRNATAPGYFPGKPVFDLDGTVPNQWRQFKQERTTATGTITDATADQPSGTAFNTYTLSQLVFQPRGLLTGGNRANNFPNSSTLAASGTSTALTINQGYMVWMRGTGSITITQNTGTISPSTGVATQGVPFWFMCTAAGTVNWTATGTIEIAQFEGTSAQLQYQGMLNGPSPYIRTTTAGQTKNADVVSMPIGPWYNINELTIYMEVMMLSGTNGFVMLATDNGTGQNTGVDRDQIAVSVGSGTYGILTNNRVVNNVGQGALVYPQPTATPPYFQPNVWHKVAHVISASRNGRWFAVNGVVGGPNAITTGGPYTRFGIFSATSQLIRRVRYYDYPIVDSALVALTQQPVAFDSTIDLDFTTGTMPANMGIAFTRASIGTYVDVSGTIQTATSGTPRWGYDPITHVMQGLLIEEARTNLLLQSGDFNNASWGKINCTVSAAVLAPDGTTTARGVISNSGTTGYFSQSITPVANNYYSASVFMKAGTQTNVMLIMNGVWFTDGLTRSATFTLSGNGTASAVSGATASASIQAYPNGWYRCALIAQVNLAVGAGVQLVRPTLNGDGTSIQVYGWGAQLEQCTTTLNGTSYIPTTTATVQRNADVATMPTGTTFSTTNGSVAAEVLLTQVPTTATNIAIVSMDQGTGADIIEMRQQGGTQFFATVAFVANANVTTGPFTSNALLVGINKCASTYQPGALRSESNGGAIAPVTTSSMPVPTRFTFGSGRNSLLSGYMRRVRYWPRVLTDAELQSVTT